jgi:protoporphyrin/coproporphyrin ferrochelatase
MLFEREPSHQHGSLAKTGIVLVNLGTPDAPTPPAVRGYLKQFLSDPRVVEIPAPLWQIILNVFILPFRPKASAQKYASIWSSEGSPLKVHTEKQTMLLRGFLGERGHAVEVAYAMRYGNPSVPDVLRDLKTAGCERLLVIPLYPQYSGTTTASVYDAVFAHYEKVRNLPELRLVKNYHDDSGYIHALKNTVLAHWEKHGRPEKLIMSFHGVPKRTLTLGDPYHCQCQKTGRLLATELGLKDDQYLVTFQSRFGKAEWLQPYTAPTLQQLARQGVKRIDVMCPGFVGDCLETLEEIAMEAQHDFLAAGGSEFRYIPCLNEHPAWIHALADITERHLKGWTTHLGPEARALEQRDAEAASLRAKAMGASQ